MARAARNSPYLHLGCLLVRSVLKGDRRCPLCSRLRLFDEYRATMDHDPRENHPRASRGLHFSRLGPPGYETIYIFRILESLARKEITRSCICIGMRRVIDTYCAKEGAIVERWDNFQQETKKWKSSLLGRCNRSIFVG